MMEKKIKKILTMGSMTLCLIFLFSTFSNRVHALEGENVVSNNPIVEQNENDKEKYENESIDTQDDVEKKR